MFVSFAWTKKTLIPTIDTLTFSDASLLISASDGLLRSSIDTDMTDLQFRMLGTNLPKILQACRRLLSHVVHLWNWLFHLFPPGILIPTYDRLMILGAHLFMTDNICGWTMCHVSNRLKANAPQTWWRRRRTQWFMSFLFLLNETYFTSVTTTTAKIAQLTKCHVRARIITSFQFPILSAILLSSHLWITIEPTDNTRTHMAHARVKGLLCVNIKTRICF